MHEILHVFNIQPAEFEKIRPIRCNLKWEPRLKMCIPGSREKAVEEMKVVRGEVH